MSNDASKMYCVRLPLPDQWEVTTSDGTGLRVECIGNIDVFFYGKSDEPITLCDVLLRRTVTLYSQLGSGSGRVGTGDDAGDGARLFS